jgi:hypothetical protein
MKRPAKFHTPEIDVEIRARIRLAVFAYAYEFDDQSLVSDHAFDALAKTLRPELPTGHKIMDRFFTNQFSEFTGGWIHQHPQRAGIQSLYERHYKGKSLER